MPKVGLIFGVAVAALAGWVSTVEAAPVPLTLSVGYGDSQVWENRNPEGNATAEDYAAEGKYQNDSFILDWDLSGKYDPTINAAVAFTNLLAVDQTFTVNVTVPVPPIAPSSKMGGSVSGSFTDANGGGVTFDTSGGTAIYTALIDGASVATLHPAGAPFPLTAGPFLSGSLAPADFGTPIPSAPGPALTTDMGIQLKFTLSPGDTASLTSVFVVEPVPEPSTVVLALAGLACGLFVVRRRRAQA
jgi:hypothetical protein